MSSPARLRDPAQLSDQLAVLNARPDSRTIGFTQGARDGLRWLLEGGPGPLTGRIHGVRIPATAIVGELAAAQDLIYGPPSPRREYAAGLEHALMWASLATTAPPTAPAYPTPAPAWDRDAPVYRTST